ncbi:MAG: hypothetical protein A3G34_07105 [Candidatus Lindowbacteria bacterium RIFCSPLOWO2_12_FULL_62_27]|nr:MAG: hypothetical protein A3G34_07105 [Candidatus Lindowbacteria bacterium RIFCSPLOWO2_12_FULL_62_27]OGH61802.1 MAG: hypothetical protein A3I06_09290 [Candidatus Lindowbacteria bacterium RIFCSPLOWO2_02_FULL_62_12]
MARQPQRKRNTTNIKSGNARLKSNQKEIKAHIETKKDRAQSEKAYMDFLSKESKTRIMEYPDAWKKADSEDAEADDE